jgi:hypothetical protein
MAELSQSARNYLEDLSHQPGARSPATLGEIWDSEWKRGGLDTISGLGKPLADAQDALVSAIESAAGKPLAEYAAEKGIRFSNRFGPDQHIATLNTLADTLPEEARKTVDPLRDVRRIAAQNAQKIERDAADVSSATYGLGGTATAWAAGIARQSIDPVNLSLMAATAPIGGPITGGAVKFIAGQAAAGAISQAAVEPVIEPARAALGLESGFGRAATNVLEAGVGGAVLGGAGVGLHRLFRGAASAYRGERPMDAIQAPESQPVIGESPAAVARHPGIVAEDFDAAALHAERDVATGPTGNTDPIAHAEGIQQARTALEEGRPTADDLPRGPVETAAPPVSEPELPLSKPIEPKGPPAELKEPADIIGDPALAADVDRRVATMPNGDAQVFHIEQPDGTIKSGPARSLLKEIADDAKAVSELVDCIGKEPA